MAQVSGSVLIVVKGPSALASSRTLLQACVSGISAAVSGCQTLCFVWFSLGALMWPPLVWHSSGVDFLLAFWGPLDDVLYTWESRALSQLGKSPCQHPNHSLTHTTIHPRGYAHSLQLNVGSVELSAEMLTVGLLSVRAEVCPLYDQLFIALPVYPHCNSDAPNAAVVSEWKHESCPGWRDCGRWVFEAF